MASLFVIEVMCYLSLLF